MSSIIENKGWTSQNLVGRCYENPDDDTRPIKNEKNHEKCLQTLEKNTNPSFKK